LHIEQAEATLHFFRQRQDQAGERPWPANRHTQSRFLFPALCYGPAHEFPSGHVKPGNPGRHGGLFGIYVQAKSLWPNRCSERDFCDGLAYTAKIAIIYSGETFATSAAGSPVLRGEAGMWGKAHNRPSAALIPAAT